LAQTLRTTRHGCTVRDEPADEKAASPSDRMEVPFWVVLGDGNARGIRADWGGPPESSKSIQLIYRCPNCQQAGNKYPKHVGITPRGRAEDVGIEIGDDEVVKIDIGMAWLGRGSAEVVGDGSRVSGWSASCEWRTVSDGGDGGRRHNNIDGWPGRWGDGQQGRERNDGCPWIVLARDRMFRSCIHYYYYYYYYYFHGAHGPLPVSV